MISGETEQKLEFPYEETELEFGNRSPMEEIETESMVSKGNKGSMISSRLGRQSEEFFKRPQLKAHGQLKPSNSIVN